MRSPKEAFLTSGHVTEFKKIVGNESFEPACFHALLQLQSEMPPNVVPGVQADPYIGLDVNAQLLGARRVLDILQHLTEPIQETKPPPRPKLNYDKGTDQRT